MMRTIVVIVALAACGAPKPPRFVNAAPVRVVNDRLDVPHPPESYIDLQNLEFWDAAVERPAVRPFELRYSGRALGTNAVDEVPDSTWFTNRIGVRHLTAAELENGPLTIDSPEHHLPWTVHSTKLGGEASAGIIISDARGIKYMIKFDLPGHPELSTGAHVVVNRILWACGYHVPEDQIVFLRESDLVIAPDAKRKDRIGRDAGPLTRQHLLAQLASVERQADGRIRAMASRWLPGKPIGGYPDEGVREDDPNDRIPHEARRDLRGELPILAWVDHTEANRSNFLDMWTEDRADKNRHYVVHYQMDFGAAMSVKGFVRHDTRDGRVFELDFGDLASEFAKLGLDDRPWGHHFAPRLKGVSPLFVADGFDPGTWHSDEPYGPFLAADRFDGFWGAALIARFSHDDLRAVVAAGRFTDPTAVHYLVDTLWARRHETLAYWFQRVNPLDSFRMSLDGRVCFDDLAVATGIASADDTTYSTTSFSQTGSIIAGPAESRASGATTCVTPHLVARAPGYTIVRVVTTRPGFRRSTDVHIARDPASGAPRVIGIVRE